MSDPSSSSRANVGAQAGISIMARMDPSNDRNNQRLRELMEQAGLTLATAMTLFNRGRSDPVTESGFKSWLAAPGSACWRALPNELLAHAEQVFGASGQRERQEVEREDSRRA